MTLYDHNPDFKVTSLFDAGCLRNGTRYRITDILQWNTNRDLYMPHWRVSFRMTSTDLEWLSEIFNDRKHWEACLRQLSFLSFILFPRYCDENSRNRRFYPFHFHSGPQSNSTPVGTAIRIYEIRYRKTRVRPLESHGYRVRFDLQQLYSRGNLTRRSAVAERPHDASFH